MDMRFAGLDADPGSGDATAVPIDFRCFVAALAAGQAATATARAAAAAAAARGASRRTVRPTLLRSLDAVISARPAGAFHRAPAVQGTASKLKDAFTLAFQPSFKARPL